MGCENYGRFSGGGCSFNNKWTNRWNEGWISADRNTKITFLLTTPCSLFKSSTKDLSFPIFEIACQHTLPAQYMTGLEVRCNFMMSDILGMSICIRLTSGKVIIVYSSMDSDLEAFSHNPTDGSFAALAFQLTAFTNYLNQRFLSYWVGLLFRQQTHQ